MMELMDHLEMAVELQASDLFIVAGAPVSCKRVIRVDVSAPFVRGRLGAQRHAQKYLRVICWTRSPGDEVRGLDASLRWDSVTRSFPLVSEMS